MKLCLIIPLLFWSVAAILRLTLPSASLRDPERSRGVRTVSGSRTVSASPASVGHLRYIVHAPKKAAHKVTAIIRKRGYTLPAHLAIGAAVEIAVSAAARWAWPPGMIAAAATAGFKEATDLHDHRDSWRSALADFAEIAAGAGIAALIIR